MKSDNVGKTIGYVTHPESVKELYMYLFEEFDHDAEEYSKQYLNLKGQLKYIRRYILIKLACLPIEVIVGGLLLGKLEVKARLKLAKKLIKAFNTKEFTAESVSELYELC